jgi:hypothetical protein
MIPKDRYLIDFWTGSHGNFLEYVINCWIFGVPKTNHLFTHTGASHRAKADKNYREKSIIVCGHYSEYNLMVLLPPEKLIRIVIEDLVGACCYQINIACRAGDLSKEDQERASIPLHVRQHPNLLRGNYFAKLADIEHAYEMPNRWRFQDISSLEVNMSCLYDFFSFLSTMKKIADFLEQKFTPDCELIDLWTEFMARNQGWQAWTMCNSVLMDSIADRDRDIDLNIQQQALLNFLLSKAIGIFDGDLFDRPDYPCNTKQIYKLIKMHLDTFDSRF